MKQSFYLFVALLGLFSCHKRDLDPADGNSTMSVSIDPAMGRVMGGVFRDTFLIRVNDENNLHAVPLVYNLARGAVARSGGRKDGIWRDTVDLTQNKVKS